MEKIKTKQQAQELANKMLNEKLTVGNIRVVRKYEANEIYEGTPECYGVYVNSDCFFTHLHHFTEVIWKNRKHINDSEELENL
jgi:hypothetical protein